MLPSLERVPSSSSALDARRDRNQNEHVSRSKHRPFRDLASRVVLPEKPKPAERFEDALASKVDRLDDGKRRIAPPPSTSRPDTPDPHFVVEHEDAHVVAWREGEQPPPKGLEPAPSSTLDLHGLDEVAARRAVQRFVVTRAKRGDEHLLIVVGKGRRSPGGYGVLGLAVVDWLTHRPCARHVAAFRTASATRGGRGAIFIRLVKRS